LFLVYLGGNLNEKWFVILLLIGVFLLVDQKAEASEQDGVLWHSPI